MIQALRWTALLVAEGAEGLQLFHLRLSRGRWASSCPMPTLLAAEIERLVVAEIVKLCRDPALVDHSLT